jgi:hypothetical protein
MTISHGNEVKQITIYPLAKSASELEHIPWLDDPNNDEEVIQPLLTIEQAMSLKKNTDENLLNNFITNPDFTQYFGGKPSCSAQPYFDYLLGQHFQEACTIDTLLSS